MATNAAPIYGKQYIRYAETWEAPALDQNGNLGVVEVGELRCVSYAYGGLNWTSPNQAAPPIYFTSPPNTIVGVNQAYMPSSLAEPMASRQLTVATSGLLLIEVDPASAAISPNTPLQINSLGQAVAAGSPGPVTLDGTTPIIRENVTIGGRNLVLVSFA